MNIYISVCYPIYLYVACFSSQFIFAAMLIHANLVYLKFSIEYSCNTVPIRYSHPPLEEIGLLL